MSHLRPGEKGEIHVSVDVTGKSGAISKTIQVFSNDPKQPVATLTVAMQVRDELHMKTDAAVKIFEKPCSNCHVDFGRGKTGFGLFRADCFMCHNAGSAGMSISRMSEMPEAFIRGVIRKGVENTAMPGWAQPNGGPLTEAEIESLVKIIKKPN